MTGVRVVRGEVRGGDPPPLLLKEEPPAVVEGGGARLMIAVKERGKKVNKIIVWYTGSSL